MKVLIIFLLLCLPAHAIDRDKQLHFIGGAVIAGGLDAYYQVAKLPLKQRLAISIGTASFIGIAKEALDHRAIEHTSEWQDAAATIAGGITGAISMELIGASIYFSSDHITLKGNF